MGKRIEPKYTFSGGRLYTTLSTGDKIYTAKGKVFIFPDVAITLPVSFMMEIENRIFFADEVLPLIDAARPFIFKKDRNKK